MSVVVEDYSFKIMDPEYRPRMLGDTGWESYLVIADIHKERMLNVGAVTLKML